MLNVTTIASHSHIDSQELGEFYFCHRIGDMFLWQLFPDGLQGDFQFISRLISFGWSLFYSSSMVSHM